MEYRLSIVAVHMNYIVCDGKLLSLCRKSTGSQENMSLGNLVPSEGMRLGFPEERAEISLSPT